MMLVAGLQLKQLSTLLRMAKSEHKTGLLSSVTGKLAPKKKQRFDDTSCAAQRDLDEEDI